MFLFSGYHKIRYLPVDRVVFFFKLLDFSKIPEWHAGLVKELRPLSTDPHQGLAVGSKLHCVMEGFTFDATITVCSKFPPSPGIYCLLCYHDGPHILKHEYLHFSSKTATINFSGRVRPSMASSRACICLNSNPVRLRRGQRHLSRGRNIRACWRF